jgi:hypothetical protein
MIIVAGVAWIVLAVVTLGGINLAKHAYRRTNQR